MSALQLARSRVAAVIEDPLRAAIDHCVALPGGVPRSLLDFSAVMVTAARRATPITDPQLEHRVQGAECRLSIYGYRPAFDKPDGRMMLLLIYSELDKDTDTDEIRSAIFDYLRAKNGTRSNPRELLAAVRARVTEMWEEVHADQQRIEKRGAELYAHLEPLLPEGLSLKAHQRDYLALAEERKWAFVNGDDQGMGKTVEANCSLLLHHEDAFPAIVICPKSVVGNWAKEAGKWLAKIRPRIITVEEDLKLPKTSRERALDRAIAQMKKALKRTEPPPPSYAEVEAWLLKTQADFEDLRWITLSLGGTEAAPTIRRSSNSEERAEALGLYEIEALPLKRFKLAGDLLSDRVRRGLLSRPEAIERARQAITDSLPASDFATLHARGRRVSVKVHADKQKAWKERPLLVVASWSDLLNHHTLLCSVRWKAVIGDEVQLGLRTHDSKTTRAFWRLRAGTRMRMALSGTLLPNGRPSQAFGTIKAVQPGAVGKFRAFGQRFCGPRPQYITGQSRPITVYDGRSDEAGFAELLSRVQIRRLKSELGPGELPDKRRYAVNVKLKSGDVLDLAIAKDQAKARIDAAADALREQLIADGEDPEVITNRVRALRMAAAPTALQAARELTGLIKVRRWLIDFCAENSSVEDPLVIFFSHHSVHSEAVSRLSARFGADSVLAGTGKMTSMKKRQALIERWQAGEGRFLVLTQAFGQGITATRARNLVLAERFYEPGQEYQIEDRVYRISQTRDVGIFYPHAAGSTDDIMGEKITWKERGINHLQGSSTERMLRWLE